METGGKQVQCVIVTPERAVLDEHAEFVAVPLYDGELGVMPGRSPLIGRLGTGELRLRQAGRTRRFFIDGGFVQVRSNVVTLLTAKAIPAEDIDARAAENDLRAAQAALPQATGDPDARLKAQERARAKVRVAEKARAER